MQKFSSWKIEGRRYPRQKTRNTQDTGVQKQYQVGESWETGALFWEERLNGGIARDIDRQLVSTCREKYNIRVYTEVKQTSKNCSQVLFFFIYKDKIKLFLMNFFGTKSSYF